MTFHSVIPEQADASTSVATGVVGHRTCATMDMTGIAVPLRYEVNSAEGAPGGFDPEDFDVTCFGMRRRAAVAGRLNADRRRVAADPESLFVPCDDLDVVMASDGLRASGSPTASPCACAPGASGRRRSENNVIASWSLRSAPSAPPDDGNSLRAFFPRGGAAGDAVLRRGRRLSGAVSGGARARDVQRGGERGHRRRGAAGRRVGSWSSQGAAAWRARRTRVQRLEFLHGPRNGCGGNAHSSLARLAAVPGPGRAALGSGTARHRGADVRPHLERAFPDKRVEPFVADTVQPVTKEAGETCALCLIEDAANYKGDPVADGTDLRGTRGGVLRGVRGSRDVQRACTAPPRPRGAATARVFSTSTGSAGSSGWRDLARQTPVPAGARRGRRVGIGDRQPHEMRGSAGSGGARNRPDRRRSRPAPVPRTPASTTPLVCGTCAAACSSGKPQRSTRTTPRRVAPSSPT